MNIIFLLAFFCFVSCANEKKKEISLSLEPTSKTRTLRVGQSIAVELKIVGPYIGDITKNLEGLYFTPLNAPKFVHEFHYKPQKKGDFILGPYSLTFNGKPLTSNSISIKVLPEWDGNHCTLFRVDRDEISLGENIEFVMETWSQKRKRIKIIRAPDNEFTSIQTGYTRSSMHIKNGQETHYAMKSWIITPKSKGEFLISKDLFREFPDEIELPQPKIHVK
jgi:hypothetical protein